MDKKSILIGLFFLVGGFVLMLHNGYKETQARQEFLRQQLEQNERAMAEQALAETVEESAVAPAISRREAPAFEGEAAVTPVLRREVAAETPDAATDRRVVLRNSDLRVELSTRSGAIEHIELLNYPSLHPRRHPDAPPVMLNEVAATAALALRADIAGRLVQLAPFYTVAEATAERVVFTATLSSGLVIERTYQLEAVSDRSDPSGFTIRHETKLLNNTDAYLALADLYVNLGTAAPTDADFMGFNLNASVNDRGKYRNIPASKFSDSGFFFRKTPPETIARDGTLLWGAVKNQFFVAIFTPDVPAQRLVARGIPFPRDPSSGKVPTGVTADLQFSGGEIDPGGQLSIAGKYYAGPKNFDRLSRIGQSQEDVMQLGWFLGMFLGFVAFVAKMLLTLMSAIHGFAGNWGLAIIITTIVIRLLLWPLTAKAARASKRMQKLQKPLQEIRERYKDNPTKLNQEMMGLWKKHKISPLSGCWPVLVQFPIFIAFFNLLRNSSDLRFAPFLWVPDLSMPDATIPLGTSMPFVGTTLNVLPFVWLVSMYFQMKMMPSPSVDNAQVKIMKWMPFIFFPFTYYFSSGLVLYWTTTNAFSIFQQWMTNRTRDEEDVAIEEEIAEMENPKKKKLSGPLISKKKKKNNPSNRS